MAMKVNYGLQRAERARAKQAKKEAKARDKAAGVQDTLPSDSEPDADEAAPAAEATPE